jgi:alkylation response protein AidB-like acyl-CoA dehydrogenase
MVAAEALLAGGEDDAKHRLLPRIAAGEVATLSLDGEPALFADRATVLLAVVGDDLLELDPASSGARWLPSMDQTIRLGSVDASGGTRIGDGAEARARAELVGTVGVAALQAGLAGRALEMTVDYSLTRVQFGRPIGSFQALKHRMADMLVLVEMCRSASWAASYALATRADNSEQLAHVAKSYCSDALGHIAAETVQLHGGIAITWEHDTQLVFKRAHALAQLFGQAHQHRALVEL